MKNCRFSILLILLFSFFKLSSQSEQRHYYADKGLAPRAHSVDMIHLKLEVKFDLKNEMLFGKVSEDFIVLQQSIDSLVLDAVRLDVKSILLDQKEIKFYNTGKKLILHFDQALTWNSKHQIEISYSCSPKKGLYFIGWNDPKEKCRKQIWTQGQGINNRHWIPMYDEKNDKLTTEMIVHFEKGFEVLSNGKFLGKKKKDGLNTWHYKMIHPHASYLMMLGIGKYDVLKKKSASGLPMNLYYYPGEEEASRATYKYSVQMFDFFESEIGLPYPWESYSQIPVQDFMYGAMENTTATIFGDFYLVDERSYLDKNYVRVDAHELAHQWFGDLITARASADHWLQESFATHYDMMYQKEAFGKDHFDWVRRDYQNQSLAETQKNLKPIAHSEAGTVRHYPKGAFVLQMLKDVVGREQFNAAIKHYLKKHAFGNVDSKDLLVAFHERLGLSLDWFWEDWVYRGGEPAYEVNLLKEDGPIQIEVKQIHHQNNLVDLFDMPIKFQVVLKSGKILEKTVRIHEPSQQIKFNLEKGQILDFVLFDPDNRVMKSVSFDKSLEQLKAQAEKAEHLLDRHDAIVALIQQEFEGKNQFLMNRYKAEKFHGLKSAIIAHILPQLNDDSQELVKLAFSKGDTDTKKAVLDHTLRIPENLETYYRALLQDSSYQVIEKALDLLAFYYPNNIKNYLQLTENEMGNRAHNVRIKHLALRARNLYEDAAMFEIIEYTSESYEFRTRINAAEALQGLNHLDEASLENMLQAICSFNSRLRGPVVKVLDYFFQQDPYKRMMVEYVSNRDWSDREFKKVKRYLVPY